MRTEWKLFMYLGIFMLPLGLIYFFTGGEEAGSLLLVIVAVSFAFVGTYLLIQSKRINGLRPEDFDAGPEDIAGEVGSFPVASIWPFVAASGATIGGLGLIFNGLFALPGLGLIVISVIGMARESDHAGHGLVDLDHNANASADPSEIPELSDQVKK